MFCKDCGTEMDSAAKVCPQCGAKAAEGEEMVFCTNCGQKISRKALICPHCGVGTERYHKDQGAAQSAQQPTINIVNTNTNTNTNRNGAGFGYIHKKKWVAFFLCLFLGEFGGHRFYVGKTGTGILYLFTFGLFGIGWVIDLILIPFGGFRDKMGQPLV